MQQVTAKVSRPDVDKRSVARYREAGVNSAWTLTTTLGGTYAFDPALMARPTKDIGPNDFTDLRAAMTPVARKDWDNAVNGLPGIRSHQDVNALATVGVNINGTRLRASTPVTDFTISGAVGTAKDGQLFTIQIQSAVLHMLDRNGDPVRYTSTRTVTFFLKQAKSDWRVSGWKGELETSAVELDR